MDYKKLPEDYYKQNLDPEVYHVTREKGTEGAFSGKYDKFYDEGTYYCASCGGDYPLYSSSAKYDSGSGWPSFWESYKEQSIKCIPETDGSNRTEIVCARCGSHLGHVFEDGPKDKTGQRHCINSLSLIFKKNT